MHRVEAIRAHISAQLSPQDLLHLSSVSQFAALLALRRDLNTELAQAAGLLHDISSYLHTPTPDHGPRGAIIARDILISQGDFSPSDIETITHAIHHHSDKATIHGPYDELLKDADVLSHALHNPSLYDMPNESTRYANLLRELSIP